MSTDHHVALSTEDMGIGDVEERLSDLDDALTATTGGNFAVSAALIYDSKATTTAGGGATGGGWNQRDLNQEVDPDSIVVVSSNEFIPIAGTYLVIVVAPSYQLEDAPLRLYNVTQSSVAGVGLNSLSRNSANRSMITSVMHYILTANGTDSYRIDQYAQETQASDGLGKAVSDGANEVYATVLLLKLGA